MDASTPGVVASLPSCGSHAAAFPWQAPQPIPGRGAHVEPFPARGIRIQGVFSPQGCDAQVIISWALQHPPRGHSPRPSRAPVAPLSVLVPRAAQDPQTTYMVRELSAIYSLDLARAE